jgi:hypothetical protein
MDTNVMAVALVAVVHGGSFAFMFGKISQKLTDLDKRVERIETKLNGGK